MKFFLLLVVLFTCKSLSFGQNIIIRDTAIGNDTICNGGKVTIAGANSVCMKGSIQFTANMQGGTWSSSNISAVGTIDQNGLFSTSTNGGTTRIMYIVTNANGCSDTAAKWITIYSRPNAGTISGDATVCMGKTIQFSTTGTGGHWASSNISAVGTISQSGLFRTGTTAGTTKIMYIVTNANGCRDTASQWITIYYKPTAGTISGTNHVCMRGVIQFTTTGTGGTWSSSNISAVGTIGQNGLFSTGTNGGTTRIMYIVTNANGCSDTAAKWITIYSRPNADTISGDATVCMGKTIQFSTTGTGGHWASSNISAVGTISQSGLFRTGTTAGTTKIMYIVTNANGCRDTASQWITIYYKPTAGTISGTNHVCMRGVIQFTTTGTGGTWSSSNISAVGTIDQNGLFSTGTNGGTTRIMYIVTNANGCSDTAAKWITIYSRPNAGTISGDATVCMGKTIQFSTTGTGGHWASSNISAVGTISQSGLFRTGTTAGTTKIMYIVTNANGCRDTASQWITIKKCLDITIADTTHHRIALTKPEKVSVVIFPNPTTTGFCLRMPKPGSNATKLNVYDQFGKTVYKAKVSSSNTYFGENWQPGIYFIEVIQDDKREKIRAVKLK